MAARYVYVWKFEVKANVSAEFEREYGPDGDWVKLFSRAPGYEGSSLLKDRVAQGHYLTIDRWRSESDYAAFRSRYAAEYDELDRRCERLTASEKLVGVFEGLGMA